MKFTKFIKPIVPYGLVMWSREKKRKATFWELYKEFLERGTKVEFLEESPFKHVVSIQGFGHSGSSAVMDVLREYENTLCLGEVDINSVATPNEYCMEVDFMRHAGGFLEIENYLDKHSSSHKDALLQRFMLLMPTTPFFRYSEEARNIFFEFFRRISYSLGGVMKQSYVNIHLQQADPKHPQIFYLNKMSVAEYRHLCRTCLNSLFATLHKRIPKDVLVLDQFFADGKYDDFKRNYDYCPNLKTINVWRDPRDIYEEAKWFGADWVPTQSVEAFIEWHKMVVASRKLEDTENYFTVRFEDLVLHYDETVKRIEKYLGFKPEQHIAPKSGFDPSISKRSVRLWKQYPQYEEEYKKIAKAFPNELYNE